MSRKSPCSGQVFSMMTLPFSSKIARRNHLRAFRTKDCVCFGQSFFAVF